MSVIPNFFLYGEAPRPASDRFAHIELLDDRSRPANWLIRPHAHPDLHHIFLIEEGAGAAEADGLEVSFVAPCAIAVPAGAVHGFNWRDDSAGRVLTFSEPMLRAIASRDASVAIPFNGGVWAGAVHDTALREAFAHLERELGWAAPGHDLAIDCFLGAALVALTRAHHVEREQVRAPLGAKAVLVARYRNFLEAHFREQPSVEAAAHMLAVSPARLRIACRDVANASPARLLQDRLLLEARRLMHYSNMGIAQIGLYLGFEDPAYFSRFFTRATGASPRTFRRKPGETSQIPPSS